MESFKAGAELGLDCFCDFNEKPIMPIIKALEKKLNKIAKEQEFVISGTVRVFKKNGPMGKLLKKIEREKIKATVSRNEQVRFKVYTEKLVGEAYKKMEALNNNLIIYLELRCWRP